MTRKEMHCHIEHQPEWSISDQNEAKHGVTQPKSSSFCETHGKEKPTSSWAIFYAMES